SVCHCLDCKRRSGSAFSAQARWPEEQVTVSGPWKAWTVVGDSGGSAEFRFCPTCGGTVAFVIEALPGLVAVPLGAFADPGFPAPAFSVWESRKHPWVEILGDGVEHM
ncbi:MAG TPA: GFA family protein, partial [Planctomycetota bacterium]|nr:GFA family protein [Planctomycetota bacterium]